VSEQLYGVSFGHNCNYNGRDGNGLLQMTRFGLDGRLMMKSCAEDLCKILQIKYPQARVIELNRGDRDEIAAQSLADLHEQTPLEHLGQAVRDCVRFGSTREQISVAVESSVFKAVHSGKESK
jgi:hypothetical protein